MTGVQTCALPISNVAYGNIRRESVDKIKVAEKDKEVSKDDSKGFQVCKYIVLLFSFVFRSLSSEYDQTRLCVTGHSLG